MKVTRKLVDFHHCRIQVTRVSDPTPPTLVTTPDEAARYWRDVIAKEPDYCGDNESVVCLLLNTKLMVMAWHRLGLGSHSECVLHPIDVFRSALIFGAPHVLLMHSHPSGCCKPSEADQTVTRKILEGSRLLSIRLQDHVIVPGGSCAVREGHSPYFSFREAGLL